MLMKIEEKEIKHLLSFMEMMNKMERHKRTCFKIFSDTKEYPNAYQNSNVFVQQKFDEDFSNTAIE